MNLYPFQQQAVQLAVDSLLRGNKRLLIASPTGTGKSMMQLAVQAQLKDCWIVSPAIEVIDGYMRKLGRPDDDPFACCITTPIVLRNRLVSGALPADRVRYLLLDEAHHHNASVWQELDLLTDVPAVGWSATPYRGTPRGTAVFRGTWGEPYWAISYPDAAKQGYITMPKCRVVPLVDDDKVEIKAGQFVVSQVAHETSSRLDAIMALGREYIGQTPVFFAFPTRELCIAAQKAADYPTVIVAADTPRDERQAALDAVVVKKAALIQIRIVSEGVDLPLRVLIDADATLSPVEWLQRFGRITRPGGESTYICTNRNLLRHCYLLEGLVPLDELREAQDAWAGWGERLRVRAFGLENFGRFKPLPVKLANGLQAECYIIESADDGKTQQYAAILHPAYAEPLWASRANARGSYGKWAFAQAPEDVTGFRSTPAGPITPKQREWWQRSAASYGLDASVEPNRRNFCVLPILAHLGVKLA